MAGRIYLLNALIVPVPQKRTCVVTVKRSVPLEVVKKMLREAMERGVKVISAVGHESTAKVMSQLLEIPVDVNRITVTLEPNDVAVVFTSTIRLPEGKILSEGELKQMLDKFEWSVVEVTSCIAGTL